MLGRYVLKMHVKSFSMVEEVGFSMILSARLIVTTPSRMLLSLLRSSNTLVSSADALFILLVTVGGVYLGGGVVEFGVGDVGIWCSVADNYVRCGCYENR